MERFQDVGRPAAVIRSAIEKDLATIAQIHVAAWHNAYSALVPKSVLSTVTVPSRLESWKQWLATGHLDVFLLIHAGDVVGFCGLCAATHADDPLSNYGEVSHLYLDPPQIGRGFGHQLFRFSKNYLRTKGYAGMLLWTLEDNSRARHFYEREGMFADGARQDEPTWLGEGVYEVRYVLPFHIRPSAAADAQTATRSGRG